MAGEVPPSTTFLAACGKGVARVGFAALDLLAAVRRHVCVVTRLRLDASLFEPAPVRPPLTGKALPRLSTRLTDPSAVLCTDLDAGPGAILRWFVSRWRVETTCQEVRAHREVETQRQWSDRAILRTTPVLLGLFSTIALWATALVQQATASVRPDTAAWYRKPEPGFSVAIAAARLGPLRIVPSPGN